MVEDQNNLDAEHEELSLEELFSLLGVDAERGGHAMAPGAHVPQPVSKPPKPPGEEPDPPDPATTGS